MNASSQNTMNGHEPHRNGHDDSHETAEQPQPTAPDADSRVYQGRSVEELIPRIEAELGSDAIVLRRRSGLAGGVAGFFQRPVVEIEARPGHPRVDTFDEPDALPAMPTPADAESLLVQHANGSTPLVDASPSSTEAVARFQELTPELLTGSFAAELAEAEAAAMVPDSAVTPAPVPQPAAAPQPVAVTLPTAAIEPEDAVEPTKVRGRATVEAKLLDVGVEQRLVEELIETASAHALPLMPARTTLAQAVRAILRRRIPSPSPLPAAGATIAFVGTGGSGKTRCCEALLDAYARRGTLSATCARIVAREGQEGYAVIAPETGEATSVRSTRGAHALRRARSEGLLALDMPSFSPADQRSVRSQAALLEQLGVDRVVLVLPATLGARAAAQLLDAARPLQASALAITHTDATDQLGVAVQAACDFGLAPEYLLEAKRGGTTLTSIDPCELAERLLS